MLKGTSSTRCLNDAGPPKEKSSGPSTYMREVGQPRKPERAAGWS